ncbi:hypothetical protein F511_40396 [Dorcoceras hygrometricum]|uniref:CCHC-type domain-containing protein n=1 Tax=Dorcoceras hygrometricum TaxID=472368 RepID=A0A2Z7AC38_9LAMI|nr:hypothetical protein F511_40396 [Dorcoceras hygrometricum]
MHCSPADAFHVIVQQLLYSFLSTVHFSCTRSVLGKWVYLVTLVMSLFDLQDVCIAIGSLATLDLPMVVDLIGIYVLKGPYCTLTTTNWFLQALSVIPRGSWGDVARRFTMIRWPPYTLSAAPSPQPHARRLAPPCAAAVRRPLRDRTCFDHRDEKFGKYLRRSFNPSTSFNNYNKSDKVSSDLKCYNCDRPGHFAADCNRPKKDDRYKRDDRRADDRYRKEERYKRDDEDNERNVEKSKDKSKDKYKERSSDIKMKTNNNKRFSRKHDRKVLVAEESTKSWADSDSDTSSSSSSSSDSEQEEVHCFMADQTDEDEVFDFSNVEFTRDDLVIALNDMVKEYRKLSHSFEEAKAESMSLKSSSAESSSDELEDVDILKTELSKLQAENELLRNEISELKAEVAKSTVEMSSWNKANISLQKLYESQKQASDKTGIGFNNSEFCEGERSTQSRPAHDKFNKMSFVKADMIYNCLESVKRCIERKSKFCPGEKQSLLRKPFSGNFIFCSSIEQFWWKFLDAWRANFAPGQGSSAVDIQVIELLSDLYLSFLEELAKEARDHNLIWNKPCCSKIFEGSPRDRGAVIARTNSNTRSTCWIRKMILVDGLCTVELCADKWVKIPRKVISTEVPRQRQFDDTLPSMSVFFRLMRKQWADVCLEVVEFCAAKRLLPVGSTQFCRSLQLVEPVSSFASSRSSVFALRVSQFCSVFIDLSLFNWLPSTDISEFLSAIALDRTVLRSVQSSFSVAPSVQLSLEQQQSSSSSSSSSSSLHFDKTDVDATASSVPLVSQDLSAAFADLQANVLEKIFDYQSGLSSKIHKIEQNVCDSLRDQADIFRNLSQGARQEVRTLDDVQSIRFNEFRKTVLAQNASIFQGLADVRQEVQAVNAKVDIMASRLNAIQKDAEATKEALSHQLLEFQSSAQENHNVIHAQIRISRWKNAYAYQQVNSSKRFPVEVLDNDDGCKCWLSK